MSKNIFKGEFLKSLIKERGLTVAGFARALTDHGSPVSRQTVHHWLKGGVPKYTSSVWAIEDFFNIPNKSLFVQNKEKEGI